MREAFSAPLAKPIAMGDKLLVVGAGTMGAGIAFVAARAGFDVELVDSDSAARERAATRIRKDAQRAADAGAVDRVRFLDAIPPRSDAPIAIEAVPERLDLKRGIFAALEASLDRQALIASNTSSLSISEMASGLVRPERVAGLHFFNPPAAMKLVEVIRTDQTDEASLERARTFVERIGKEGVTCADTPGFIVNRVARPFYLQAMRAYERNVASIEELDALARAAGFRMGPFELMDLIGLDVNLATTESVYARLEAERLVPQAMQREMVAQGRLGRKTGVGFYGYEDGRYARLELAAGGNDARLDETVVVIGFGGVADGLATALEARCDRVTRVENDDMLEELDPDATLVIDVGDGWNDRRDLLEELDRRLDAQTVIFADAYATDIGAIASRLRHPDRVLGYGILGALDDQSAVEIVDGGNTGDDALALAQEVFETIGKAVVLVEDRPGLFLGRLVGGIVNEAMIAIADGVALPDDVDRAMKLGVNYPRGPIEWGREIGGARIGRILKRLANAEGEAFAPHRSLWVLDAAEEASPFANSEPGIEE
jgi:3-hydroxybutyryl-CoA dehydrogenase